MRRQKRETFRGKIKEGKLMRVKRRWISVHCAFRVRWKLFINLEVISWGIRRKWKRKKKTWPKGTW